VTRDLRSRARRDHRSRAPSARRSARFMPPARGAQSSYDEHDWPAEESDFRETFQLSTSKRPGPPGVRFAGGRETVPVRERGPGCSSAVYLDGLDVPAAAHGKDVDLEQRIVGRRATGWPVGTDNRRECRAATSVDRQSARVGDGEESGYGRRRRHRQRISSVPCGPSRDKSSGGTGGCRLGYLGNSNRCWRFGGGCRRGKQRGRCRSRD